MRLDMEKNLDTVRQAALLLEAENKKLVAKNLELQRELLKLKGLDAKQLELKLAELECIRGARRAEPILLLDDVSSELDPTRIGAVYDFLRGSQSQVFVTTTRPELFQTPGAGALDRQDYRLKAGALELP